MSKLNYNKVTYFTLVLGFVASANADYMQSQTSDYSQPQIYDQDQNPYYYQNQPSGNYQGQSQGYYQNQAPNYSQGQAQGNYQNQSSDYYQNQTPSYYQDQSPSYENQYPNYYQNQGLNNTTSPSGAYQNPYYSSNNKGNGNKSDEQLLKKIHDKISPGWFSKGFEDVTIQIRNGAVTLGGTVKSASDKEEVEREVRDIRGVRSLNSQINVREPSAQNNPQREFPQDSYASSADDQLNKKIRDTVSKGWFGNSYKNVSLNTSNGVVTLEGTVSSQNDQQKLINEVQKIDGVRSVRNNLTVRSR